jgi:hypothetical protein
MSSTRRVASNQLARVAVGSVDHPGLHGVLEARCRLRVPSGR